MSSSAQGLPVFGVSGSGTDVSRRPAYPANASRAVTADWPA
jgi:hypothetical protein